MDEEQSDDQVKFNNRQSFIQRLSSNRSLDRNSEKYSNSSLTPKHSFIDALDIEEPQRKSNSSRLSQMDEESANRILRLSGSSKDIQGLTENYQMFDEIPSFNQKSQKYQRHECSCQKNSCNANKCPCFISLNQLCVIGLCCTVCINKKNQMMSNQSGSLSALNKQKKSKQHKKHRQNNHIREIKKANKAKILKQKYDFVYCTCKKTQCMKKYCPCYAMNKQCNECCICEECQNKSDSQESVEQKKYKRERYGRINQGLDLQDNQQINQDQKVQMPLVDQLDEEIDNYFEDSPQDYSNLEMNKNMDFQPVNFSEYSR